MFVLLILIVAFYSFIYLFLKRQNGAEVASKNILKTEIIACIIIAMEAGVYLFFRRRLVKRVWAQTHVFLLYFALIILPILFAIIPFALKNFLSGEKFHSRMGILLSVRFYIYWACILIGHVFFFLVIRQALTTPSTITHMEPEGLLDEFGPSQY